MLRRGPLPFYGRISYGLYMTHISVFIYFGWFDLRMDPYGIGRESCGCCFPTRHDHASGDGALVRIRIADFEVEALLLGPRDFGV